LRAASGSAFRPAFILANEKRVRESGHFTRL
jgi:hypothetical protein